MKTFEQGVTGCPKSDKILGRRRLIVPFNTGNYKEILRGSHGTVIASIRVSQPKMGERSIGDEKMELLTTAGSWDSVPFCDVRMPEGKGRYWRRSSLQLTTVSTGSFSRTGTAALGSRPRLQ